MKASYACLARIPARGRETHECLALLPFYSLSLSASIAIPFLLCALALRQIQCCARRQRLCVYQYSSVVPCFPFIVKIAISCFPSLHQVQLFFCEPAFSSSAFSCTEKSSLVSSSSQLSSHRCVAPACDPTSSSLVQSVGSANVLASGLEVLV